MVATNTIVFNLYFLSNCKVASLAENEDFQYVENFHENDLVGARIAADKPENIVYLYSSDVDPDPHSFGSLDPDPEV